jgi:hypothetical protein
MPLASDGSTVYPVDSHSGGHQPSLCWKIMEIVPPESQNVLSKSDNNLSKDHYKLREKLHRSRPHSRTGPDENCTPLPQYSEYNCTYGSQLYSWFWRSHICASDCHYLIPLFPEFSSRWLCQIWLSCELKFLWQWKSPLPVHYSLDMGWFSVIFAFKFWGSNE